MRQNISLDKNIYQWKQEGIKPLTTRFHCVKTPVMNNFLIVSHICAHKANALCVINKKKHLKQKTVGYNPPESPLFCIIFKHMLLSCTIVGH